MTLQFTSYYSAFCQCWASTGYGFPSERVSNACIWWFLCCYSEQAVQYTVELPVVLDAIMFILCHCNAALCLCCITWIDGPYFIITLAEANDMRYIPSYIHMVLLCFIFLWLYDLYVWIHEVHLTISFRVDSMVLVQFCYWSSPSEPSLKNEIDHYLTATKPNTEIWGMQCDSASVRQDR